MPRSDERRHLLQEGNGVGAHGRVDRRGTFHAGPGGGAHVFSNPHAANVVAGGFGEVETEAIWSSPASRDAPRGRR
jgi:hypothetical protein